MAKQSTIPGLSGRAPGVAGKYDLLRAGEQGWRECGVSPAGERLLAYLVRRTAEIDWHDGDSMPVVWTSVTTIARDLGISPRRVNEAERHLVDNGWVVRRNSARRRRWGERDPETGCVVRACGLDLQRVAERHEEVVAAVRAKREAWRMKADLREESFALRSEIRQRAADGGQECELDRRLLPLAASLEAHIDMRDRLLAMRDALEAELPDGGGSGGTALRTCADAQMRSCAAAKDLSPRNAGDGEGGGEAGNPCAADDASCGGGPERPASLGSFGRAGGALGKSADGCAGKPESSVMSDETVRPIPIHSESVDHGNRPPRSTGSADPAGEACIGDPPDPAGDNGPGRNKFDPDPDFGVQHLDADRVAAVASELWRREADGAGWRGNRWACEVVRLELGIHDHAWNLAVRVLGIRATVVLVAVIDGRCRDKATFVRNPSGFVVGCVKRAQAGGLHLHRSIWGLERHRQWREAGWAYAARPSAAGSAP